MGGVRVLAAHGLGLGPWVFDAWRPFFEAAELDFQALALPGHGDGRSATLADVVGAIEAAIDAKPGPVALVAHSMSGLAAQLILARRTLHAAVLVCPLPVGNVPLLPPSRALQHAPRFLAALAAGRPYAPSWRSYRALGFSALEEGAARDAFARLTPWPIPLVRDLAARPRIDPALVQTPVLVALGGRDPVIPWVRARLLGDLYEAVVWRYDDLAHTPMLEPGGGRMGRDVAAFCAAPRRPQVIESEGYTPTEGIGVEARRARRGELMKKRSAYGQKKSAR